MFVLMNKLSRIHKWPTLFLAVALFIFTTASSSAHDVASHPSPDFVSDRGNRQFVIASSNNFPPINQLDEQGHLDGFGKDISDAVIEAIGGTSSHIHSGIWSEVLSWLAEGKADFIHDTGYSAARTAFLDYSEPILTMPEAIFVRVDRFDIASLGDLKNTKVACVNKHVTHLYLKNLPAINCHVVATPLDGLYALLNGDVAAFIFPRQILLHIAQRLNVIERLKIVGDPLRELTWHMTVRKGDREMLDLLNQGITKIKTSGQYDDIYEHWFGRVQTLGYSQKELSIIIAVVAALSLSLGILLVLSFRIYRTARIQKKLARTAFDLEQADRALGESEERFKDFAESSSDWFWETDGNNVFTFLSGHFEEVSGISTDLLLGKTRQETKPPGVDEKIWQPLMNDIAAHRPFRDVTFSRLRPDGEKAWFSINGVPHFDGSGNFLGYRGTGTNITERRQAEESLRKSEERYRATVEGTEDLITIVDENGQFLFVNHAAYSIFGISPEECVGLIAFDFIHPQDREQTIKEFQGWIENKETAIIHENRQVSRDGNVHHVSWKTSIHYDSNGENVTLSGIARDITERKSLEEQLLQSQKMEVIGHLAGGVAHDFNNLLGVMIGNAELLLGQIGNNEKVTRYAKAIIRAVERGSALTQRLLAFSRKQTLSPQPTAINGLVLGLEEMLQRTLGETVKLHVRPGSGSCEALIDPHQFENALINLAVNSRDAMPSGGVLTIETAKTTLDEAYAKQHKEVTPGDYIKVSVHDNGVGMTPEVLEKVFDPFFTTKDVGQGSGLGLSMVYGFVKQSNGHVTLNSDPGLGTTVELYLPSSQEAPHKESITHKAAELARGSERILVVEDDNDLREIPASILSDQGYEVIEASNGDEAIKCLQGQQFDLLFTDVVLPGGMNGVEIADQAKLIQPDIKVLYTSGYAEDTVAQMSEMKPDVTLIHKPYHREQLLGKVRNILDGVDD